MDKLVIDSELFFYYDLIVFDLELVLVIYVIKEVLYVVVNLYVRVRFFFLVKDFI